MKQRRNNAGFTLIELMIVVAIIAIIASVAIPKLMSARLSANESAAIATLRSLSSAQAQVQSSAAIDTDSDGGGEYGSFGELSGSIPLRIGNALGVTASGAAGIDELTPSVLSAAFGNVIGSMVTRSGYVFQIWLPTATAGLVTGAITENPTGGFTAAPYPDSNNGEIRWGAYAWPLQAGSSANRVFFVNQEGDLLQTANRQGLYTGVAAGPPFAAVHSVGGDIGSPLGLNGVAASDGNLWTVVQ